MPDTYAAVIIGGPEDGKIMRMPFPIVQHIEALPPLTAHPNSYVAEDGTIPEAGTYDTITYDLVKVMRTGYSEVDDIAYYQIRKGDA